MTPSLRPERLLKQWTFLLIALQGPDGDPPKFPHPGRRVSQKNEWGRSLSYYSQLLLNFRFFFPLSGRFGKVHRCTEKSSGLRLAAKVINTRNAKEKVRTWSMCVYVVICVCSWPDISDNKSVYCGLLFQ